MTWVVVVVSGSWAKRVIGPMAKDTAEALARGLMTGGTNSEQAIALPLEAP